MALPNYPLWTYPPNWTSSVTETLEWMTNIMSSPSGAEQREAQRLWPRRWHEFSLLVGGNARARMDNQLEVYGALPWHLPIWHEAVVLGMPATAGANFVQVELPITTKAAMIWQDANTYELLEVNTIGGNETTFKTNLTRSYPDTAILYPVVAARLTDQPKFVKHTDSLWSSEMRFIILDPLTGTLPAFAGDTYSDHPVIRDAPDEKDALDVTLERILVELDNKTAIPLQQDTAVREFRQFAYNWITKGRTALRAFENMLYALKGRAVPIWLPTFQQDFELVSNIASGSSNLTVRNVAFSATGGPRRDKQHIMIETIGGQRFYRRINLSSISGQNEILTLNATIPQSVTVQDVLRICFMSLVRLNSDQVQIDHLTDTEGLSSIQLMFRSAPDLRVATSAF